MSAPDLRILSIGCSCINRFQFDFFIERHPEYADCFPRGLFDWNITTLEVSLNVLRRAAASDLMPVLGDGELYYLAQQTLIFNTALPGFSFFHEATPQQIIDDQTRRAAFLGKIAHLAEPFVAPPAGVRTHLVWSNLQPNLPDTVENVFDWETFQLTPARYAEVKTLGRRIYGVDTTFSFLSTPQDMQASLADREDVHCFDIPRSEAFKGDDDLYEEVLMQAILAGPVPVPHTHRSWWAGLLGRFGKR